MTEEMDNLTAKLLESCSSKGMRKKILKMTDNEKMKFFRSSEVIAFCKSKDILGAAALLHECAIDRIIPDVDIMSNLICLFGGIGEDAACDYNTSCCLTAFELALSSSMTLKEPVYTALIRCLAKDGRVAEAKSKLCLLKDSGIDIPRLRTYYPLIVTYMELRDIDECFNLLWDVLSEEIVPNECFMTCLLKCCQQTRDDRFWFLLAFINEFVESELTEETALVISAYLNDVGYSVKMTSILDDNSQISSDFALLSPVSLSDGEFDELKLLMDSSDDDDRRLSVTSNLTEIDIILDGANIGYYQQVQAGFPSPINYHQLSWLVDHLRLNLNKRIKIVLHTRHLNGNKMTDTDRAIVDRWVTDDLIIETPKGRNDDVYWITACLNLGSSTMVVTNDEMRDHLFSLYEDHINRKRKRVNDRVSQVKSSMEALHISVNDCLKRKISCLQGFSPLLTFLKKPIFDLWRDRHVIQYDYGEWSVGHDKKQVILKYPSQVCRICQQADDGRIFVPIKSINDQWLIATPSVK